MVHHKNNEDANLDKRRENNTGIVLKKGGQENSMRIPCAKAQSVYFGFVTVFQRFRSLLTCVSKRGDVLTNSF